MCDDNEFYCEECGDKLQDHEEDFCTHCRSCVFGDDWNDPDSPYYLIDGVGFADPGGNSALRAETEDNPRDRPCPACGRPRMLTRIDEQRGYQCDDCADAAEAGY